MSESTKIKGAQILLVDDDPDVLELFALALRTEGAEITTASDGDEAVAALRTTEPDLVVLDMMLPKRSGFLVLERIQELSEPPPVLMVTANEGRRHKAYAKSLGVGAYLNKPVAMEQLLETIETLL